MKNIQPAILLNNVTKKYYYEKPRSIKKWFNIFLSSQSKKFTVINDLSLNIKKGEFVLIKGPNGCGKTTLLRIIAGITYPDEGEVHAYGKVVPLIELGAGFNHELTGRENIVINATILGMEKSKINFLIDKIISFSGLKKFIDTPIKKYSSGMVSRLAFSIAVYSDPDILLLDEIFAVGDKAFRKKSINKLKEFKKKGVTVLLCTHFDFNFELADRVLCL